MLKSSLVFAYYDNWQPPVLLNHFDSVSILLELATGSYSVDFDIASCDPDTAVKLTREDVGSGKTHFKISDYNNEYYNLSKQDSVSSFFRDLTFDRLTFTGDTIPNNLPNSDGWHTFTDNICDYANMASNGKDEFRRRVLDIALQDSGKQLSDYDTDGDGIIDNVTIHFNGYLHNPLYNSDSYCEIRAIRDILHTKLDSAYMALYHCDVTAFISDYGYISSDPKFPLLYVSNGKTYKIGSFLYNYSDSPGGTGYWPGYYFHEYQHVMNYQPDFYTDNIDHDQARLIQSARTLQNWKLIKTKEIRAIGNDGKETFSTLKIFPITIHKDFYRIKEEQFPFVYKIISNNSKSDNEFLEISNYNDIDNNCATCTHGLIISRIMSLPDGTIDTADVISANYLEIPRFTTLGTPFPLTSNEINSSRVDYCCYRDTCSDKCQERYFVTEDDTRKFNGEPSGIEVNVTNEAGTESQRIITFSASLKAKAYPIP
jgi:hypothetical protein